ncbi:hypothetical protein CW354_21230 [Marinicaulis flavus]|uniref:Polyhydroxyalkanoic acid system protein n=2 Tax=Hyphococcus luteus TaxID=2058213 RepID=A0A2S7JYZ8_9PROT|nr:hypothetical protein CW354_21230 [Marinicaulis flavus]
MAVELGPAKAHLKPSASKGAPPMARPVTVTISHDLGKEEAKTRVREGFDKLKNAMTGGMMFKFSEEWTSEDTLSFTAKGLGQEIAGTIDIFPEHVRIIATLPGLLASLAETVAGKVEKEGKLLLEHK